ncbi:MAG TPA: APC family permease [Gemmatimonadaceae bacterium]
MWTATESRRGAPPPAIGEQGLIRAIGRWALTAAVINTVVGSGVFGLPAPLTSLAGQWSPVAVLLAGAGVFVVVLCFAEVGSRFDGAGGPYLYARETFGPAIGFQIGWLHIWTRLLSAAAVLNVLASYLTVLVPWTRTPVGRAAAITVAVTLVTIVNLRGVRHAAWTVNAFTVAKLVPLVGLVLLGTFHIQSEVLATQGVVEPRWTEAILLLVFAFGGFESAVVAGSESRDPRRDTSFALMTAMISVTVLYFLVQFTIVGVLPNAAANPAPVSAALGILVGPPGITIGSVAVIVSVYGWLTGFALMTPRIPFAMAARGELPRMVARVHAGTRVPDLAIVLNSLIALTLGLISDFSQLATFAAISRLAIFASTCGALVLLRRIRGPSEGFRAPGGPMLALSGVAFSLWLLSTRSLAEAWFLPAILATGVLVWVATRRARHAAAETAAPSPLSAGAK